MRALVILALVVAGCGKSDPAPPDGETAEYVELTLDDDGKERGNAATDDAGMIQFYSPKHQALFSISLANQQDAAAAGVEVRIEVDDDSVSYFADDPSGTYMPLWFTSDIPTQLDEELVVDGAEQLAGGDVQERPHTTTRRGPPTSPLLVGVLVSINVRGILTSIGTAAVLAVAKKIVEETCTLFAPLHEDVCGTVADVVEWAGAFVGGVRLALGKGYTFVGSAVQGAWGVIKDELIERGCGAAGKYFVTWLVPAPDGEKTVQRRYREVAYDYRYLLDKLDTAPPADPADRAALIADLKLAGKALAGVGNKVRDHYYELYNLESDDFLTDATFGVTAAAVKNLVEVRPVILNSITLAYGYEQLLTISETAVTFEKYEFFYGEVDLSVEEPIEMPEKLEFGIDCGMAAAKNATIAWMENGTQQTAEIEIEQALGDMVDIIDEFLEDVHADYYGGDIPDPTCLPDIWEPNDTWQESLAAPFAGTLGSGVVMLEDVNLCDGMNAGEEDWYTYDAAPINFQVQARIRKPMNGTGGTERVCLDLFWYSQVNELTDSPPTALPGGACGTVDSEFSTSQIGVAQSTGEAYRYVMVRVRPDPSAPTPMTGVDYNISFTH